MQVWLPGSSEKHPTKVHTLRWLHAKPWSIGQKALLQSKRTHAWQSNHNVCPLIESIIQVGQRELSSVIFDQSMHAEDQILKWRKSSLLLSKSKKWLWKCYKSLPDKASGCSKSETALAARTPSLLGANLQDRRDAKDTTTKSKRAWGIS